MAKNVYSYVSFEGLSDKASDVLLSLEEPANETETMCMIYNIPYEGESTDDVINSYDWYIDNIGAKWISFEDISEYGIAATSAGSPPIAFYDALFEKLRSLDSPNMEMWCRYDDEMPNFVGVYGRYKDTDYDECVGDGDYQECIGDTPYNTITDEDGKEDVEWSDTWNDSLDVFCEKEYGYFREMIEEYSD